MVSHSAINSTTAPYLVQHANGNDEVLVDQSDINLSGQWNFLGQYDFSQGANAAIELSSKNGSVNADAVKLIKVK